jgi:hypothetical protein
MLIGKHGGDPMMARIGVMKALHRHMPRSESAPRRKRGQELPDHPVTIAGMTPPVQRPPRSPGNQSERGFLGGAACGRRKAIMRPAAQGSYDGTARYPRNPQDRLHRKLESEQN